MLIGVDETILSDGRRDDWLDRPLLHVGQHAQHDLTAALDQTQDGRLVYRQRAAPWRACQSATTSEPAARMGSAQPPSAARETVTRSLIAGTPSSAKVWS
jgi:hypothetical protein